MYSYVELYIAIYIYSYITRWPAAICASPNNWQKRHISIVLCVTIVHPAAVRRVCIRLQRGAQHKIYIPISLKRQILQAAAAWGCMHKWSKSIESSRSSFVSSMDAVPTNNLHCRCSRACFRFVLFSCFAALMGCAGPTGQNR